MTTIVVAGLLLGLGGSLHCAAMCGPLAVFAARRAPGQRAGGARGALVLYHAARILVYALLGWAAGRSGQLIADAGVRRVLSLSVGIAIVAGALATLWRAGAPLPTPRLLWLSAALARTRRYVPATGVWRHASLGIINGLLPCGLLYSALLTSAAFGAATPAVLFMIAFGVGSVPALAGTVLATRMMPLRSPLLRRAAPMAAVLVGLLLIGRGLAGHDAHQASGFGRRASVPAHHF